MNPLTLLHLNGQWAAFDGQRRAPLPAYPQLDRATVVVTDFDGALNGVAALEGRPTHAGPLIERRLRSDGLIDGEAKVVIHGHRRVGDGYQALYTAIPIEQWQRLLSWAESQADHCLLVPHVALMWRSLKPGHGMVLRAGSQLTFVAALRNRIVHASALAFSASQPDLQMATATLAERMHAQLAKQHDDLAVDWCSVVDDANDTTIDDAALSRACAERSGVKVRLAPHFPFSANAGARYGSALSPRLVAASAGIAVNPLNSRGLYIAERALPWVAAASLVLAAGLAGIGGYWSLSANTARDQASAMRAVSASAEQKLLASARAQTLPPGFERTREFIEKTRLLQQGFDPHATLLALRDAAAGEVRILRLQLSEIAVKPGLRIEGLADQDGTGARLARFVERLRGAGFEPMAVDPSGGASAQPAGFFAYQLVPAPAAKVEVMP